ncbi:MAG: peptidoglycan-binding protein [Myxococcota bacterium]
MPRYTARARDCIHSIAAQAKVPWEKIWDDPANKHLREQGRTPECLEDGDTVTVPDIELRWHDAAVDQRHRFRVQRRSVEVHVQLLDTKGEPLADRAYEIECEGATIEGTTDGDGMVITAVPARTREARLRVPAQSEDEHERTYELEVGALDPVSTIQGAQARLRNLQIDPGAIDGELGPWTREALRYFQQLHGLDATGELDDATAAKLTEVHDNE